MLQLRVWAPVFAGENRQPGVQQNRSIHPLMKDQETQQKFVELRTQGRSFARIAEELQVSKRTLIEWSRKFQFEILNQRAIELEALRERYVLVARRRSASWANACGTSRRSWPRARSRSFPRRACSHWPGRSAVSLSM